MTRLVLPGRSVESQDASLVDCVLGGVFDQAGLRVEVAAVVFMREFLDHQEYRARNLELIVGGRGVSCEEAICQVEASGQGKRFNLGVRWARRDGVVEMVVQPEILKDVSWTERVAGLSRTTCLGVRPG